MSTPTGQQQSQSQQGQSQQGQSQQGQSQQGQSQQAQSTGSAPPSPRSPEVSGGTQSESSQGRTTVADVVVSKIAGMAARDVSGVYGFGGGTARAFGAMRERIPGARASSSQGVTVEVGEKQAAIDLIVVVEYGVAITELAQSVRRNVIGSVEQMTGLDVVEVNIDVTDMHMPGDDTGGGEQQSSQSRVT